MGIARLSSVFLACCLISSVAAQCDVEILPSDISSELTRFGSAVAISGDIAVVGAHDAGIGGAVYVYRFDGSAWNEEQILVGSDVEPGDDFGQAVSIDGDLIAVGSRLSFSFGACTLFRHDGVSWIEEQKILCPANQSGAQFGRSVSIQGSQVFVGAPGVDFGGVQHSGAAYLFGFDGVLWQLEHTFGSESPNPFGQFGSSVDFDPLLGRAAVGEEDGDTATVINCGAVHHFVLAGPTWSFAQKSVPIDPSTSGGFGKSISLSGDHLLVGAPRDGELGMLHGAAYVLEHVAGLWSQQTKFLIPGINIQVGNSVSLSGDTAMIGTESAAPPRVVVYTLQAGEWTLHRQLIGEQSGIGFGRSVSVDGNRAIVGAPEGSDPSQKSARIYSRDNGQWQFFGFQSHPIDTAACPGEPLVLSAETVGVGPSTYQWQRNGVDIPGQTAASLLIDPMIASDIGSYAVVVSGACGTIVSGSAEVTCRRFIRGDSNGDGWIEPIGDAIFLLQYLFGGGAPLPCQAAADADGSGNVQIGDSIYMLAYGFISGPVPPAPFPDCGHDPAHPYGLSCNTPSCQ